MLTALAELSNWVTNLLTVHAQQPVLQYSILVVLSND